MPRPTASLRGSHLLVNTLPAPAPQIIWQRLPLRLYDLWYQRGNLINRWEKVANDSVTNAFLFAGFIQNNEHAVQLMVKNQDDQVLLQSFLPVLGTDIEVRFYSATYTIDIRHFRKGTNTLISRWAFEIDTENPTSASRSSVIWNRLTDLVARMPLDRVRYANIPRSLDVVGPVTLQDRYAFRQTQSRLISQVHGTDSVGWFLPNMGITFTYTGVLATPEFQELMQWIRFKIKPKPITAPPTTPAPPAHDADPIAVAKYLRLVKRSSRDLSTVCGYCYEGPVPVDPAQVKKKRARKEWIGCESGINCPSDNFWFHLSTQCAGIVADEAPKKNIWWCKHCRVNRPNATEKGLERRSRARNI